VSLLAIWYLIRYHLAMSTTPTRERYVAELLREARHAAGLTLRELAQRAETSHATLSAYEQARKTPSATTLLRILEACGNAVDIELHRRVREVDGIPRGEELEAVLKLASAFPSRASRRLELPVFPHG
jgi:transcriptional regulator with XRE-family HTH domain